MLAFSEVYEVLIASGKYHFSGNGASDWRERIDGRLDSKLIKLKLSEEKQSDEMDPHQKKWLLRGTKACKQEGKKGERGVLRDRYKQRVGQREREREGEADGEGGKEGRTERQT